MMLPASRTFFGVLSITIVLNQAEGFFDHGSPMFLRERLLPQDGDCILNSTVIASIVSEDLKTTISSNLGSTFLSAISMERNERHLHLTICDARFNTDEYALVKCMNLTSRQEREMDENRRGLRFYWPRHNQAADLTSSSSVSGGKRSPRLGCTFESSQGVEGKDGTKDSNDVNLHEAIYWFLLPFWSGMIGLYLPLVLSFFCSTEIIVNGLRHINLQGPSPVSFQSVIGNNFFPRDLGDRDLWYKVRLIVVLPVLFLLLPFLFYPRAPFYFANAMKENTKSMEIVMTITSIFFLYLTCCTCFMVDVICICLPKVTLRKRCFICHNNNLELQCRDLSFPQRITHHSWQLPSKLREIWRKNISRVIRLYFVSWNSIFLSSAPKRLLFLAIFVLTIPVFTILLPIFVFLTVCYVFFLTSPFATIFATRINCCARRFNNFPSKVVCFLGCKALFFIFWIVAQGIWDTIIWASPLLLSHKNLPYLICFILIFYYLASSHSSFTSKYQELGFMLHKQTPAVIREDINYKSISSPVVIIPKELFDRACVQLMPKGKMICKLLLRMIFFLGFVSFVFFSIENSANAEPAIRILLTLLGGSLPKIIEIFSSSKHKSFQSIALEEKVRIIVDCYNRSITVRTV